MARAARGRGGPGYASLIIFIVLCLLLIAGYVPLSLALAKRHTALQTMENAIRTNLEGPLGGEIAISANPQPNPDQPLYDAADFQAVAEAAKKGLQYDDLVKAVGYEEVEEPIRVMTEELQAEGYEFNPAAGNTVRAYINQLEDDLSETALLLANTSRAKETLEGDYADTRAKLQSCQQQMQELRNKYERDVAEAQREYEASVAEYKADYEKANQLQEEWYAKFETERETRKAAEARLSEQVQDLQTTVTELREELERKKPQPVKVTEGEILQADATEGIVVISLGEREEIETGETFTVMRVVTGGDLVPKGVVKVVRVEDLTARADIIEMDPDHIIMKGDIVRRQKQVTESM